MDLIITGGNTSYFNSLKCFVKSLRENARYADKVVICDNTIGGLADKPGIFYEKASFSCEELSFFKEYRIEVAPFHELLKANGIPRGYVDSIHTSFWAYPFKFIYSYLLSKQYLESVESVCYFASDFYFQKPLGPLFKSFDGGRIIFSKENSRLGKNAILKEWLNKTDLSFATQQGLFLAKLYESSNFCSGFIGGKSRVFNSFSLLCWLLAASRIAEFHSDQPLVNILTSYFNYPIREAEAGLIINLYGLPEEDIVFDPASRLFSYKSITPLALHFNGDRKHLMGLVSQDNAASYRTGSFFKRMMKKFLRVLGRGIAFIKREKIWLSGKIFK